MDFLELPAGRNLPHTLNAVIEIPRGSSNKYEYDKELQVFRLDRTLYSPVHYPGAYGFVPRTLSEDGDPLDVVVIVEHDTFPGCLIEVRPLGVLVMADDAGLDHKILAVPINDPRMRDVHGLQHLPRHYLAEVDYFFNIYKELEGKKSDTYGWEDRLVAHQVIGECVQRYQHLKAGLIDRWNNPTPKGKKAKVKIVRGTGAREAAVNGSKGWKKPDSGSYVNGSTHLDGVRGAGEGTRKLETTAEKATAEKAAPALERKA
jgi:inorganic pyrophosphatase